ncbi:LuxR C-terminal-related transcriptional regulator [Streptomyces sp. NPDC049040]|uniref:helix-turn-helix transcriptional regulator n=1 Tax=Streptomyces sp. NPDC049040 TaxID=3365593 RepID=UPI0037108E0B
MGRDEESAAAARALDDVRSAGVLVHGPCGVGKSRLADSHLSHVARKGGVLGRAVATAAAADVPLGAIAHLLPAHVDWSDPVAGLESALPTIATRGRAPRAVLVDDVQWLDPASAVLLRRLMDKGAVRLIATLRSGAPQTRATTVLLGDSSMLRQELAPLAESTVGALLRTVLGCHVTLEAVRRFFILSGGTVLHLRELVLGALYDGHLALQDGSWVLTSRDLRGSPWLRDTVERRLTEIGQDGADMLQKLALAGPLPDSALQEAGAPAVLRRLQEKGLVTDGQEGRQSAVRLVHPLHGELLRSRMTGSRRRAVLLAEAHRVGALGARRGDDLLRMAVCQAEATGSAAPVLLGGAAGVAFQAHDHQRTAELLDLIPAADRTAVHRLHLAQSCFQLGRFGAAEEAIAQDAAATAEEELTVATAHVRVTNLVWQDRAEDALRVNRTAVAHASDPARRAQLRYNEGVALIASGRPSAGVRVLEDLPLTPEGLPSADAWVRAAVMKATGLAMTGRCGDAVGWARRAAEAPRPSPEDTALFSHPSVRLMALVPALTEAGRFAEARDAGLHAHEGLLQAGMRGPRLWAAVHLGRLEWLAGRVGDADGWYREALALAQEADHLGARRVALSGSAACSALSGDLDAARLALARLRDCGTTTSGLLSTGEECLAEAWLLAVQGHLTAARGLLSQAAAVARSTGHLAAESLLITDVARLGGAKTVLARAEAAASSCDGVLAAGRLRFVRAAAGGDAAELLATGDELTRVDASLLAAEAYALASAAFARTGESRQADLASARTDQARALCQGATTPCLRTTGVAHALTGRELEIALIASDGAASKEIAGSLSLSVRTVDNYLQRVYKKLGIVSRRELVRLMHDG